MLHPSLLPLNFYGGVLESVLGQCETGHWCEISEKEAMNLAASHLQPTETRMP